ncbi:alpha/beta fold hydrolase [Actinomadura rupiterrae]|uniref:alpha/beta fold hydrolase n=1 Tax=Actinomadura rupiterrae TaxID=559627 RepID=UPI0020A5CA30|nr:alpha/beta hydrolase [Actinomadura rupiterrae]MCP2338672.1 pimeloyl-ACP methyl ester carboxylesterase [Actinomadura rupiterrae]
MRRTDPVDGFRLAYDRSGAGPPVLLLHGWPGDRDDHAGVSALLSREADVVVPDLRGFGDSDTHADGAYSADAYGADAQARSIIGLIEELGLAPPVIGGYDIGSRIAQTVARVRPDLVRALVVSPPLPGIGDRVLTAQDEFWYQAFHQLDLPENLIDGRPDAVRTYLSHFWSHWSGPDFDLPADRLDHLVAAYAAPGAFTASIGWYRAGAGAVASSLAEQPPAPADRIRTPTTVLWPDHDPLFPITWSDRLDAFFSDVQLSHLQGTGHFTPVERPDAAIAGHLNRK